MVYTPQNAPPSPDIETLPLQDSATRHGITWSFEVPTRVGQFVNGDFYVVGPVVVSHIDPTPRFGGDVPADELDGAEEGLPEGQRVRNGSMLNPPARQEVAYDSGIRNWFRPELMERLPIRMKPGDSLVSTISLCQGEAVAFPYHGDGPVRGVEDNSPIKVAAVLTCVEDALPADAFRPSYCDRANRIYHARDLQRDLLPGYPHPYDGIMLETGPSDLAFWVRVFQRSWVNTGFFGFEQPMESMPHYEQWIGQAMSVGGLALLLDWPAEEREELLICMVQVGIDYWGVVRGGHPGWQGWGGHGSGRKFPIVLAGLLLGEEDMAAPTRAFPQCNFGEDNQTMYGQCWTGARVVFAGHSGVQASGEVERPKWGPYEHLHPRDWDQGGMRNVQSEAYRRANTSSSWVGQALVLRLLKAESCWHHDAFFDYVDRWMTEPDAENRREINGHWPNFRLDEEAWWTHQGNTWEPFVARMWQEYRTGEGMPPTDGWMSVDP